MVLLVGAVSIGSAALAQDESGATPDVAVVDLPDVVGPNASSRSTRPHWIAPRRGDGPALPDGEEGASGSASANEDAEAVSSASSLDWRRGTEILVHGEPAAERLSEVVEALLRRQGAETVERRPVEISAATDQVRYFHTEDAASAAALAEALEPVFGDVRVRDLTAYRPPPPPGSLEIWLR